MSDASMPHCQNCLEPEYACQCIPLNYEIHDFDRPEDAVIAYRSLTNPGVRSWGGRAATHAEAAEECNRLNLLYQGKVEHFLLPPSFKSLNR